MIPAVRVHDEEPGHERVEGVFAVVSPDGVSAFPEVRVEAPLEGVEWVVLRHGGKLGKEDGEGTLLCLEQNGAHRGEEGLAIGSLVGVADGAEVLLEVSDAGGGVEEGGVFVDDRGQRGVDAEFTHEEGRGVCLEDGVSASHVGEEVFFEGWEFASTVENVAGLGVFGEDAEFGFEEVGVDGDEGGTVEQFSDGIKVVRVLAVAVQPRDDAPLLEQGVQFLCQPRGIDSAHQLSLSSHFLAAPSATEKVAPSTKAYHAFARGYEDKSPTSSDEMTAERELNLLKSKIDMPSMSFLSGSMSHCHGHGLTTL